MKGEERRPTDWWGAVQELSVGLVPRSEATIRGVPMLSRCSSPRVVMELQAGADPAAPAMARRRSAGELLQHGAKGRPQS